MAEPAAAFAGWIGRTETARDLATRAPLAGLAATLDHAEPPWRPDEVPPLGHWLYFLPDTLQRDIAEDGHARKGSFLPPVPLPRRMWAGSKVTFHMPIALNAQLSRRSMIKAVEEKRGRSGALAFVTVQHEVHAEDSLCITELQDIVYREAVSGPVVAPTSPAAVKEIDFSRVVDPNPPLLFRYSALTFNGHRIHYDRGYARDVEGYAGLVVHGPLVATLLVDLFLRNNPGALVTCFSFRGMRPLLDTQPFTVCGRKQGEEVELWALDAAGFTTTIATLEAK